MDNEIKVDIVLPFYNKHKLLSRCLKSVAASGHQNGRIVIVNDGSDYRELKAIEGLCSELPLDIKLISHESNKGYKESILTGSTECNSPYVILLNSDTVVTRNFVPKLTGVMLNDSGIRAVAPISNHPTDLYQFRERLYLKRKFDGLDDHQAIISIFTPHVNGRWFFNTLKRFILGGNITIAPYLSANCLVLDREVFERAGYLYGEYEHGYFEDLDLTCRIRELGYKLAINEDCFVFHRGQGSYQVKSREWKEKLVWKNYYIFEARWGHLPEHDDLVKRMIWAGEECPI
jgi:GT2 family glycosyltransferase